MTPVELIGELDLFLKKHKIDVANFVKSESSIRKRYRYDNIDIAKAKYIINYCLDDIIKNLFIDTFFNNLINDEKSFAKEWYLNEDQLIEMRKFYDCIGSHAMSHNPLAKMSIKDVNYELIESKKILESVILNPVTSISYPLGNKGAVSKRDGILADEAGYKFGFTMEREWNNTLNNPTFLARIDCNDLPAIGKKPIFFIKNNKLYRSDGTSSKRTLYK